MEVDNYDLRVGLVKGDLSERDLAKGVIIKAELLKTGRIARKHTVPSAIGRRAVEWRRDGRCALSRHRARPDCEQERRDSCGSGLYGGSDNDIVRHSGKHRAAFRQVPKDVLDKGLGIGSSNPATVPQALEQPEGLL